MAIVRRHGAFLCVPGMPRARIRKGLGGERRNGGAACSWLAPPPHNIQSYSAFLTGFSGHALARASSLRIRCESVERVPS